MLSTCCLAMLITFRWDGDELEDERLDMAGGIQPKLLEGFGSHDVLVDVVCQRDDGEERGVLRHKRFWKPAPSEAVVHFVVMQTELSQAYTKKRDCRLFQSDNLFTATLYIINNQSSCYFHS